MPLHSLNDCIVAIATPNGVGAIGVIRMSGDGSIALCNSVFSGKDLTKQASHTVHFGWIKDQDTILDEVLVTIFKAPTSYTKQESLEISCHGSPYILQEVVKLLLRKGARLAEPGEFTKRAFLNGRFDLAQAEAVADLIASDSQKAHEAAIRQIRGGFSNEIKALREELIGFTALIELELDFAEEDVEFANRPQLIALVKKIHRVLDELIRSFHLGNVIKNGVPTVIAGKPNAGKSTLLNALLNEEKAIVSDIPGTTRDFIEDQLNIDGIMFRFIDTAGLREAEDSIEAQGIARTLKKMEEASLIIYLFDVNQYSLDQLKEKEEELKAYNVPFLLVGNKTDLHPSPTELTSYGLDNLLLISAAQKIGIEELKVRLSTTVQSGDFKAGDTIVTNIRHYHNLVQARDQLQHVLQGLDIPLSGELLSLDIREALHSLGEITGEVTNEDILGAIFSKFCIGK
jgi:tRNA modification GTPase